MCLNPIKMCLTFRINVHKLYKNVPHCLYNCETVVKLYTVRAILPQPQNNVRNCHTPVY